MQCYQCQNTLTHINVTDNREKKGEIIFHSTCSHCNTSYETQLVTISILAQQPGNDESLTFLKHCYNCEQLYPEEQEHYCHTSHIPLHRRENRKPPPSRAYNKQTKRQQESETVYAGQNGGESFLLNCSFREYPYYVPRKGPCSRSE